MEHIRACLRDLRGCWKHKFLTKRQSFQWRKDLGLLFLVLSNMKKVKEQKKGPEGKLTSIVQAIWSVFLDQDVEKRTFQKKGYLPGDKRIGPFFSCYRVWQASGDNLQAWKRYFNEYCGSYRVNTVTPKGLLETQIFEKNQFFSQKHFLASFFSYCRTWQTSGNSFSSQTTCFESIVQATWWFI